MRLLPLFLMPMLLLGCCTASATPTAFVANPSRTIAVTAQIGENGLAIANQIMDLAAKDANQPIDILINSPGGSVTMGEFVVDSINAVKSRGIAVRCISVAAAASMAFSILDACSERYALKHTKLLFHPAKIMIPGFMGVAIREDEAKKIYDQLHALDEELIAHLLETTGMDEKLLREAFFDEKFWDAEDLAKECRSDYLHVVDDVRGIPSPYKLDMQH